MIQKRSPTWYGLTQGRVRRIQQPAFKHSPLTRGSGIKALIAYPENAVLENHESAPNYPEPYRRTPKCPKRGATKSQARGGLHPGGNKRRNEVLGIAPRRGSFTSCTLLWKGEYLAADRKGCFSKVRVRYSSFSALSKTGKRPHSGYTQWHAQNVV